MFDLQTERYPSTLTHIAVYILYLNRFLSPRSSGHKTHPHYPPNRPIPLWRIIRCPALLHHVHYSSPCLFQFSFNAISHIFRSSFPKRSCPALEIISFRCLLLLRRNCRDRRRRIQPRKGSCLDHPICARKLHRYFRGDICHLAKCAVPGTVNGAFHTLLRQELPEAQWRN